MSKKILELKNVNKYFITSDGKTLKACNNINLDIEEGKITGIVGESGCGKSTLVRLIVQLEKLTEGEILYKGKDISKFNKKELRENRKNIQMIFQDAHGAFNPRMTIKDILTEPLLNFGLIKKEEKEKKAKELLNMVELSSDYLNAYPHNLSGGQLQRVGIARVISLKPEILICDEATSALDVSIQKSIIELLKKIQRETNMSIIFICHDLALVQSLADEVVVMYLGHIVEKLKSKNLKLEAKHPYTHALIKSVLSLEKNNRLEILEGDIPSPILLKDECPFVNRCKSAIEVCKVKKPKMKRFDSEHEVMCHLEF